jgi:outer membrane lipoprotein-sorting protein
MGWALKNVTKFRKGFLLLSCMTLAISAASAQETTQSLAKKLQAQYLNSPAVSLAFDLANEGRVTISADMHNGHISIESPSMLIISDGHTIWSYQKREDRVTIDNVAPTSAFHDPGSLFRFADNYTSAITNASGAGHYTLELTPLPALQPLLKSAGEIQKIMLALQLKKQYFRITSATATSSKGTTKAEKLTIKTLPKIHEQDFIFKPKSTTKIIDLRE